MTADVIRLVFDLSPEEAAGWLRSGCEPCDFAYLAAELLRRDVAYASPVAAFVDRDVGAMSGAQGFRYALHHAFRHGNHDPTLADVIEATLDEAFGASWRRWTKAARVAVRQDLADRWGDAFRAYDEARCQHTTRAGRRCSNRADACPPHDGRAR